MSSAHAACTPIKWPKDSQKYDIYTNGEGTYELLFSSQQPKAKDFRRHCFNVLFPHVRQQLSDKSQVMQWKLKVLQVVSGPLRLQMGPINKNIWGSMKSISKPLRKRMQQLHCLMMIYKIVNSTKRRISSPCPRPYYQLPCYSCKRSRQRQHCYDYWEKYRPRGWWVLWVSLLHCKNTMTVH